MIKKKVIVFWVVLVLFIVPLVSAGFFSNIWDKITGMATTEETVDINISVSGGAAPVVYAVYNDTMTDVSGGLNEGPFATYVEINFSVSDANTYTNLNDSSAKINFTKGAELRENVSCARIASESSGDYANYTCNVTMWWFDTGGDWLITAYIEDLNSNSDLNNSRNFTVGTTAGFEANVSSINWGNINPGATVQESTDIMGLNNTGNLVRNIEINATNLYGEDNSAQALWAANFSVKGDAGCGGTSMVAQTFTPVSAVSVPIGNYTFNNGTAQEELYFCLEAANSILDEQAYSTSQAGAWTVKIVV